MGRGATSAKAKVATKRPAAPKSATRKKAPAAHDLAKRLAASLAQQKATSEILRVMSASPGDVQPVLDAVARPAARLCDAPFARILLVDGDVLRHAADYSTRGRRVADPARPVPFRRSSILGRAALDRKTIHITDVALVLDREYPDARANAHTAGFRTILAVPLMRDGIAYGGLIVYRRVVRRFTSDQVALVETFARQAAIAIDNVRLFHETSEALDRQTATSEILRVISESPTDLHPVFDAIVRNAVRLCAADHSIAARFDGELLHPLAFHGFSRGALQAAARMFPMRPSMQNMLGRAALKQTVDNLPDMLDDPHYSRDFAIAGGWRSGLGVPMLRDGKLIGAIAVSRKEPGAFSDHLVSLLKTFADQAVIAIENVRLFTELEARNRDLTEALEQQTATSDILKVISQSQTDVQPVFDTIVRSVLSLCDATFSGVYLLDGESFSIAATAGLTANERKLLHSSYPRKIGPDTVSGRAALECRVVQTHDLVNDPEYSSAPGSRIGARTVLGVPMMRDGRAIGSIGVWHSEVKPFTDAQIALLHTFTDQAVIAIENVRLFRELEARNRDITESLEQQTATSEILRVIARSPTDTQPVFDMLAQRAGKLCDAEVAVVSRFDGGLIELAAIDGIVLEGVNIVRGLYPMQLDAPSMTARVVRHASVVQVADVLADPEYGLKDFARAAHYRAGLGVPIIRDKRVIGAIFVGRASPGSFTDSQVELLKTFADQAVIAIENVRLFTELEARNCDITEALEQQTATSDILRVISQSQTDVQPVFETIAAATLKLCRAGSANVLTFDGTLMHIAALAVVDPEGAERIRNVYPSPASRDHAGPRAIMDRSIVAVHDVLEDPEYVIKAAAIGAGFRSVLAVPLLRDGTPIGAIVAGRPEPGPFSDKQIALLQTFADQAVIAIENARLFSELQTRNREITEALEQQTATSDILRVISGSPTDVQPVFEIIGARAEKLCQADLSLVSTLDGEMIKLVALHGMDAAGSEAVKLEFPMRLSAETVTARTVRSRAVIHIPDVLADPLYETKGAARAARFRCCLGVPMLREDQVVGAIFVARTTPGLFADTQVELLKTFADQAVIAIENVRLFRELDVRNRDLSIALDQQTATSDILRVISNSQTDVQPVFDAIVRSAVALCGAEHSLIFQFDGEVLKPVSRYEVTLGFNDYWIRHPMRPGRGSVSGRATLDRRTVHIHDVLEEPDYEHLDAQTLQSYRTVLSVPMLRDERVVGVITSWRNKVDPFSEKEIELVEIFADQAAIAIENVRLFTELEARTKQLTRSVGELKALSEVGQAVSSTLDLETVLSTIVTRATQLAGMDGGAVYEYDAERELFYLHTADKYSEELIETLRNKPIRKGEGALGRMAVSGEPVEVHDVLRDRSYQSRVREILIRMGYRAMLAVPLLREDHLLGGLVVNRKSAGEFSPQVIELLKTFASQSALAIQNARLFREIEAKSRELETASRHKSEFLANMSHELRTPLNAIIGFSEVLSEKLFGEINAKQEEYVGDILESGRHLLDLINDILDLSKIEAGRMELEFTDFELPKAVENALTLVRERASRHGIRLDRTVDERVGTVRADERKVKQVLLNLLSNALKFTPEGGHVDVRVTTRDSMAEVAVTDTGVGIAPEDQEAVFEEFKQVGAAAKKREGTGLGLAISRKFIELHGGRIWVESQLGKGSTFTFSLPLALGQSAQIA
ncbi:MAG: GAF domain-containing protein [Casimicrobiaceae bacterium]